MGRERRRRADVAPPPPWPDSRAGGGGGGHGGRYGGLSPLSQSTPPALAEPAAAPAVTAVDRSAPAYPPWPVHVLAGGAFVDISTEINAAEVAAADADARRARRGLNFDATSPFAEARERGARCMLPVDFISTQLNSFPRTWPLADRSYAGDTPRKPPPPLTGAKRVVLSARRILVNSS